jgi:hypothetical protein
MSATWRCGIEVTERSAGERAEEDRRRLRILDERRIRESGPGEPGKRSALLKVSTGASHTARTRPGHHKEKEAEIRERKTEHAREVKYDKARGVSSCEKREEKQRRSPEGKRRTEQSSQQNSQRSSRSGRRRPAMEQLPPGTAA